MGPEMFPGGLKNFHRMFPGGLESFHGGLESFQVAWKVSRWPGKFPGGLESFQVAWRVSRWPECFQVAWKVSRSHQSSLQKISLLTRVMLVKSLEGILTHQSHINQVNANHESVSKSVSQLVNSITSRAP